MKELLQFEEVLDMKFTPHQLEQCEAYFNILEQWTAHTNLTAIKGRSDIVLKHFADSMTCLSQIPKEAKMLIDVGTGAGFPGMIIAIMRPDIKVTLVDSVGKKIAFLTEVAEKLQLKNVTAIHARAEDLVKKGKRETFDFATARAVAFLPTLLEFVLPLIKVGGTFLCQKLNNPEEVALAENALKILGGKIEAVHEVKIPGLENHSIIEIKKVSATPVEYPRETSLLLKKVL